MLSSRSAIPFGKICRIKSFQLHVRMRVIPGLVRFFSSVDCEKVKRNDGAAIHTIVIQFLGTHWLGANLVTQLFVQLHCFIGTLRIGGKAALPSLGHQFGVSLKLARRQNSIQRTPKGRFNPNEAALHVISLKSSWPIETWSTRASPDT